MLLDVIPKLPMRNKLITQDFYTNLLGFKAAGSGDYDGYLMLKRDEAEIHFFEFAALNPLENYGQVYIRVRHIEALYASFIINKAAIHPNGALGIRPWGQKEFSILDPDHNLLTFGESS